LKKVVFLSLSLLLLVILIPGCFTFTAPASQPNTPSGQPAVMGTFNSYPSSINRGGTSTLSWNMTGANSVSIDHGIGQVDIVGSRVISPVSSTTYTITAINPSGTITRTAVTYVNPTSSTPPISTSFAVTGITVYTSPSNSTGCFNLNANITANGPGTATYIWESADGGGYSYTWSITFPSAGSQIITLPVEMSALPSGMYQLRVLTPNEVVSNSTYYSTCAP